MLQAPNYSNNCLRTINQTPPSISIRWIHCPINKQPWGYHFLEKPLWLAPSHLGLEPSLFPHILGVWSSLSQQWSLSSSNVHWGRFCSWLLQWLSCHQMKAVAVNSACEAQHSTHRLWTDDLDLPSGNSLFPQLCYLQTGSLHSLSWGKQCLFSL